METNCCSVSGTISSLQLTVGARGDHLRYKLVKEIDFGKELDKIISGLTGDHGSIFTEGPGYLWNVLIDKAEMEAYNKIQMIAKGEEVLAHGVLHRWFTNVSGR